MITSEMELQFIHRALLDGFNLQSLRRLLKFRLDKELDHITQGENLSQVVYDIIDAADAEGWLPDLVAQAKAENPGNYFISLLGGDEGSMQPQYGSSQDKDDINEIRIVLFGSRRGGTLGFIETTNAQFAEINERMGRLEIVVNERSTVSREFFESWWFRVLAFVLGLSAVGSLIAAVVEVLTRGA